MSKLTAWITHRDNWEVTRDHTALLFLDALGARCSNPSYIEQSLVHCTNIWVRSSRKSPLSKHQQWKKHLCSWCFGYSSAAEDPVPFLNADPVLCNPGNGPWNSHYLSLDWEQLLRGPQFFTAPKCSCWGAERVALQGHFKPKAGLEVLQDGLSTDAARGHGWPVGIMQIL